MNTSDREPSGFLAWLSTIIAACAALIALLFATAAMAYDSGHQKGVQDGWSSGYNEGLDHGYENGVETFLGPKPPSPPLSFYKAPAPPKNAMDQKEIPVSPPG